MFKISNFSFLIATSLFMVTMLSSYSLQGQTIFRGTILEEGTKTPIEGVKISINSQGIGVKSGVNGTFSYLKPYKVLGVLDTVSFYAQGYKDLHIDYEGLLAMQGVSSKILLTKADNTEQKAIKDDKVIIYWDISTAAKVDQIANSIKKIDSYVTENAFTSKEIVFFNTRIVEKRKINSLSQITEEILKIVTNNSQSTTSNYNLIKQKNARELILISNGRPSFGSLNLDGTVPLHTYLIGNTPSTEIVLAAQNFSGGTLLNEESLSSYSARLVQGQVKSGTILLSGVTISKRGSYEETYSDSNGRFTIEAQEGDILSIKAFGMKSEELLIEDETKVQSIELKPLNELLDEIIVQGKKSAREEDKIETGFGKKTEDQLGTSIGTISSEDIGGEDLYLSDVLRGRFAGVRISGFGENASISIRNSDAQSFGLSSIGGPPIWIIDGALFELSLSEINGVVDPSNIDKISVLKSANATTRYGGIAANGAIIIKTKVGTGLKGAKENKGQELLAKNNTYFETVDFIVDASYDLNKEIKKIESDPSDFSILEQVLAEATKRKVAAEFYLDAAFYFKDKNVDVSNTIIDRLLSQSINNLRIDRIVAYFYESTRQYDKAQILYERILKSAPKEAQSYIDLASIYKENKNYTKALNIYFNILSDKIYGVNFTHVKPIVLNELRHLVSTNKDKIDFSRLPNNLLQLGFNIDSRILVSWSDRAVPFELQFVNPDKKFFTWSHTLYDNSTELRQEQEGGFQIKEFTLENSPSGFWLINLDYYGDTGEFDTSLPPYLKYTLYRNYGTPQETKKVEVIKLDKIKSKKSIDSINME